MTDSVCVIRPATVSDLEALGELDFMQSVYHAEMDPEGMHLVSRDAYQQWWVPEGQKTLADPDSLVLVGEGQGGLRGYLVAKMETPPPAVSDPPRLYVEDIYVRDGDRGKGLGRLLLDEACRWGRGRGATRVVLEVSAGNPALGFYQTLGFQPHGLRLRKQL